MNHDDAVPNQTDDTALPESYSTFWDAVPIPDGPATDTPAPPPATQNADDAYAAFMALSEDGPSMKLHVERY
jgi:hypothetical protein